MEVRNSLRHRASANRNDTKMTKGVELKVHKVDRTASTQGLLNGNAYYDNDQLMDDYIVSETSFSEPLLPNRRLSNGLIVTGGGDLDSKVVVPEEASWQIGLQVFLPYLIAGLGMVGAGVVLDHVQVSSWIFY